MLIIGLFMTYRAGCQGLGDLNGWVNLLAGLDYDPQPVRQEIPRGAVAGDIRGLERQRAREFSDRRAQEVYRDTRTCGGMGAATDSIYSTPR